MNKYLNSQEGSIVCAIISPLTLPLDIPYCAPKRNVQSAILGHIFQWLPPHSFHRCCCQIPLVASAEGRCGSYPLAAASVRNKALVHDKNSSMRARGEMWGVGVWSSREDGNQFGKIASCMIYLIFFCGSAVIRCYSTTPGHPCQ